MIKQTINYSKAISKFGIWISDAFKFTFGNFIPSNSEEFEVEILNFSRITAQRKCDPQNWIGEIQFDIIVKIWKLYFNNKIGQSNWMKRKVKTNLKYHLTLWTRIII